ncbi:proteasome lid subunit RPN8/RPN11 [Longimicrobium terrae]|uniref:Proteasome lid subunit RPN8/RPN11 n=1 Tax=Longimicrobium terrae TaxID=1639882 RepID=A0A841H1N8_9BACT|nr:proteasome lid subunit RPN8/RPN11 [Longimicrobium terrae]MBB6071920.1 proteasome lid subunit RPN8/RPN11 [Longimicrobium terrae]
MTVDDGTEEPVIVRPPGRLERLVIPATVLSNTLQGLALGRDREMLAFWIGAELPGTAGATRALVSTVAFPRIRSGYSRFELAEGEMGHITRWCGKHGLWILAQVHTHPTDEDHSEADEAEPVSHRPGFLSVVIPYFARFSTVREPRWRAYEHQGGGDWRAINPEVRFEVLSDVWISGSE